MPLLRSYECVGNIDLKFTAFAAHLFPVKVSMSWWLRPIIFENRCLWRCFPLAGWVGDDCEGGPHVFRKLFCLGRFRRFGSLWQLRAAHISRRTWLQVFHVFIDFFLDEYLHLVSMYACSSSIRKYNLWSSFLSLCRRGLNHGDTMDHYGTVDGQ